MFHVIPVLKMSVHVTCIFIEQLRERDIFKIGLLYTEQEECSCKPILLKEKILCKPSHWIQKVISLK